MKRADDRTITDLTDKEVEGIARVLLIATAVDAALHGGDVCAPDWEDVPMLSEVMWERVSEAVKDYSSKLRHDLDWWQRLHGIDVGNLIDEAQA